MVLLGPRLLVPWLVSLDIFQLEQPHRAHLALAANTKAVLACPNVVVVNLEPIAAQQRLVALIWQLVAIRARQQYQLHALTHAQLVSIQLEERLHALLFWQGALVQAALRHRAQLRAHLDISRRQLERQHAVHAQVDFIPLANK